nr:reverse transcriptase domain-containing protein [Tanacetum cinerariifolium]
MRTRSQSRNNFLQQEAPPAIVEPLCIELLFLEDQLQEEPPEDPPEVLMADNQTMAELLQAPTEGYEDAIVILEITANNFELKNGLINLVQNKQFFGHDKEDPHAHIRYFNKITSTMRVPNVPSSSIKLMLFPFSLEGAAQIWLEKEAPRSIVTWDDLVTKFINQFFLPLKTTNLCNEITRFQQRFDESCYEAWERFNDLLRACPHHGFSELYQLDTFYNALNVNDQDSLNSDAGGNFLDKIPRECLKIIESKSKVNQPLAYQAPTYQAPIPQTQNVSQTNFKRYVKANDAVLRNIQSQGQSTQNQRQNVQNQLANLTDMVSKLLNSNTASSSGSGTLPGNMITNPKEDLKDIITQSGVAYQGPTIPTPSKVVKPGTEVTKDQVQTLRRHDQANEQIEKFYEIFKDMSFDISFTDALILMPKFSSTLKALIGNKEKLSEMARTSMNEHCLAVILNKFPRKLGDPGKFLIPCEFPGMDECLALADLGASIHLMLLFAWEGLSLLELTPTCMTLELTDRSTLNQTPRVLLILGRCFLKTGRALIDVHKGELTLRIENEAITYNLDQTSRYSANYNQMMANKIDVICEMYSQEVLGFLDTTASGNPTSYDDPIVSTTSPTLTPFRDSDFLLLKEAYAFLDLEDDPNSPEFNPFYYDPDGDIFLLDAILNSKPLPPLPNHKQYMPSYKKELKEGDNKLTVIISKELEDEEKSALIKVLKSHKQAIAWKLSDIQGINPEFCTHKVLMEEDYKPAVQHQRRVNPKIYDVIKKEVEKLLDAGLIYPISDSPWVSPVHCVPKKMVLLSLRMRKMSWFQLVWLPNGNEYYCFLDGFFGYFQISIDPRDQEKTTFTCPYGTFSYRRMPFGLCNAPGTFQRCMLAIFHDMVEKTMEVFMDDFSVFGNSFENCLSYLDKMIEVDKAKVDVIAKLPHPTTVMLKYGVTHRLSTAYHPQTSGQVEVSNRGLKRILERAIGENHASWTDKLDDALWAFRTVYKTPIRCTPYKLVYGKACHLPIELEHKAYWALKQANFDLAVAGNHRKVQLNKLNELFDHAYENSLIYKEKTKRIHDSKIKNRVFNVGDRVLLFNSGLKIFSGKLKTRWSGPFTIAKVFPYGTVELSQANGPNFKVNGHRVKHYFGGDVPQLIVLDLQTFPMEN